jgi:PKD repeat protein
MRFHFRQFLAGLALLGVLIMGITPVQGQCPVTTCTPGSAPASSASFGMGIFRVQLASLDTSTAGGTDGYGNYACRPGAVLQRGNTYTLNVRTNPYTDETVRAWLDYDDDGQFASNELILASTARQHAGTFTVPAAAVLARPLRLRIAADYANAPVPGPCSTPQYSQTEDYRIVCSATAPLRPTSRFAALDTVSCGGPVVFRDQSGNSPTTWRWTFGDGTASTQQHPQHTYAQPGTYSVRLRVCNAVGCDSLTKTGYVLVQADAPRPAPCQPATIAACCGFGVTRVRLAGLDHASAAGTTGYEDFSCAYRATLRADYPALLQLTTGPNAHDVRVYLDLNDNGQFDLPAELLYQGAGVQSPVIQLLIPAGTGVVYNRPLRLRLWADAAGATAIPTACTPLQQGQAEDYAVALLPNAAAPVAGIGVTYTQFCPSMRTIFSNTTVGGATSYSWTFGDGTPPSTAVVPPPHVYSQPGPYEIRLVARNAYGTDTARYQVVATTCGAYCTAAGAGGSADAAAYFTRVQLANLDNVDARSPGVGYRDFTARYAELQQNRNFTLRAESPPWSFGGLGPWVVVTAAIDYNQDGTFSANEQLGSVNTYSPYLLPFHVPLNARPGATRLRIQIRANSLPTGNAVYCTPPSWNTSTEDYTVVITSANVAPQAGFRSNLTTSCSGTVQFQDTSSAAPSNWYWTFGDGTSSTQQHPLHTYGQTGTYNVSLRVTNQTGTSTVTRASYLIIAALNQAPVPTTCLPITGPNAALYFSPVSALELGPWIYNNPGLRDGYRDETCAAAPIAWDAGSTVPVTFRQPSQYQNVSSARLCRLWLDANDNGLLDDSEQILQYTISGYVSVWNTTLTVPTGTVRNRPLRLRMTYFGYDGYSPYDTRACVRNEEYGQTRDFTVVVAGTATAVTGLHIAGKGWSLFPNPAPGAFNIRIAGSSSQPLTLEVLSALGQPVLALRGTAAEVQAELARRTAALAPGAYLVRLRGAGLGEVQRVVKE